MRSRNIKPGIFKNEILGVEDPLLTIVFMGLWCAADRSGRMEDRPLRLKVEILPYRDTSDFIGYLTCLERLDFIQRYEVNGERYIYVKNFEKHQHPHKSEKPSELPAPPGNISIKSEGCPIHVKDTLNTRYNPSDSLILIPDYLIPDSRRDMGAKPPNPDTPKRKKDNFIVPTIEEIKAHCIERNNNVDPERFFNFYESKGWMVGKNKMKNWKSCVITWEKGEGKKTGSITGSYRTDQNLRAAQEFINDGR